MYERHQLLLLKNFAGKEKRAGNRGFVLSFERGKKVITPRKCYNQQERFFDMRQGQFFSTASRIARKQLAEFPNDKLKVVLATLFDDDRLHNEFESLFYHWWSTNKAIMTGEFEAIRV